MESKLEKVYSIIPPYFLLIEPVWNRNLDDIDAPDIPLMPFNRTSMESKPVFKPLRIWSLISSFNRTSMESKHLATTSTTEIYNVTFNRTSMESKQENSGLVKLLFLPF